MRKLRTPLLAAAIVGSLVLCAVVLAWPSASAPVLPPMMSTEELRQFSISRADDVTSDPSIVAPAPTVAAARAVEIAAKWINRPATNIRVLHGTARPIQSEAARSVWIILFAGGDMPVGGPPGAVRTAVPLRYTGVEVDDETGEVLTWFMH